VPGVASASKQALGVELVGEDSAARHLGVTLEEFRWIQMPHYRIGNTVRYSMAAVEDFKLRAYLPAGKPLTLRARKRKADPTAAGKLQVAVLFTPVQAAAMLTVSVEALKEILKSGALGHIDYGPVQRFLRVDLTSYLQRSLRTVRVAPPKPLVATTPASALVPQEPPAPALLQRPKAALVRKVMPHGVATTSPTVTTATGTPAAVVVREALPAEPAQSTPTKPPVVASLVGYPPRLNSDTTPPDDDSPEGSTESPAEETHLDLLGFAAFTPVHSIFGSTSE